MLIQTNYYKIDVERVILPNQPLSNLQITDAVNSLKVPREHLVSQKCISEMNYL